jgi:hypothetical protein
MTMLKKTMIALMIVAVAAFVSCSNDHGTEPGPFDVEAPSAPTDLSVTAGTEQATIAWDYDSGSMGALEEFRIYYYFAAFDVVELAGTTTSLIYTDTKLVGNVEYCYKVSAVDTFGMEGWRTDEECAVINTR